MHEKLLEVQQQILGILKEKLPPELTYHCYDHTIDVLTATEQIAKREAVNDKDMMLLKTAAVFHDMGYIYSRENHEQKSCDVARKILSHEGIDSNTIEKICDMIMATIVPQNPKNKLGQIICDADLDYLGREDYFPISQKVFEEFKHFGVVKDENEWKRMQVKFLESHHYFTQTSNELRNPGKLINLNKIKNDSFTPHTNPSPQGGEGLG